MAEKIHYTDFRDTYTEVDASPETAILPMATFFGAFFTESSTKFIPVAPEITEYQLEGPVENFAFETTAPFIPDVEFGADQTIAALAAQMELTE